MIMSQLFYEDVKILIYKGCGSSCVLTTYLLKKNNKKQNKWSLYQIFKQKLVQSNTSTNRSTEIQPYLSTWKQDSKTNGLNEEEKSKFLVAQVQAQHLLRYNLVSREQKTMFHYSVWGILSHMGFWTSSKVLGCHTPAYHPLPVSFYASSSQICQYCIHPTPLWTGRHWGSLLVLSGTPSGPAQHTCQIPYIHLFDRQFHLTTTECKTQIWNQTTVTKRKWVKSTKCLK